MMLTEAEAKEKWCPFARPMSLGTDSIPATNGTSNLTCIGSACMAWRWDAWRCGEGCGTVREGTIEVDKREPCSPPPDNQQKYYDHIGHCGLAGEL